MNLKGYEKKNVVFKHKSRIYPKELNVTVDKSSKKKTKVRTDQNKWYTFLKNMLTSRKEIEI